VNGVSREDLPTSFLIEILEEKRKEKKRKKRTRVLLGKNVRVVSTVGLGLVWITNFKIQLSEEELVALFCRAIIINYYRTYLYIRRCLDAHL
jgi:hypothetical protein